MSDPSPFRPDLYKDKTILVTGGSSGIGFGIAESFARHGARTLITGRSQERLDEAAKRLLEYGVEVDGFAFDVRDKEAVGATAQTVVDRFGPLDVLVNNAAGNFVVPFSMMSENAWQAVIDIVLQGTFNTTRAFGRAMIDAGKAAKKTEGAPLDRSILNIVAGYAWTGSPGVSHSGAAKAAVLNLTKSLGVEWAEVGVRVNAISPGPIEATGGSSKLWEEGGPEVADLVLKSVPMRRFGTPRDIGQVALFLASPAAGYVTGTCMVVDGGSDARGPLGFDQLLPRWV